MKRKKKRRTKKQQAIIRKRWLLICAVVLVALLALLTALAIALPKPEPEAPLPPPEANPYGPMDFQYDGKYLTCTAGESMLGIDVSAHQGEIDWQQVKDAGIEFVMIRAGYRGYRTPVIHEDPYAQANYKGAKAAGLKVGAYFFSQAVQPYEAVAEALLMSQIIADWELDLPAVYDWERVAKDTRAAEAGAEQVTACAKAFCSLMEAGGYSPMVYFNPHHAENFFKLEELTDYPFWLANYTDRMTYEYKVEMWQYTNEGRVPGISGDVDLNLLFLEIFEEKSLTNPT